MGMTKIIPEPEIHRTRQNDPKIIANPCVEEVVQVRHRKQKIPKAVREQLWLRDMGKKFEGKCKTSWCNNKVTLFDYQCGHNVPESKGGPTALENLVVICSRCNTSMGNQHTFSEWSSMYKWPIRSFWKRFLCGIT
jgi:5-methylcytosine-specific restriction endonuclease McrA